MHYTVIYISTQRLTEARWAPVPLMSAVRELLDDAGFRHQPLGQFHEHHPMWRTFGSMLKNVRVQYTTVGGVVKERRIRGILPRAPTVEFTRNGQPTTVGVCRAHYHDRCLQY